MKDLKIGPLLLNHKALLILAFCLFVNMGSVAVYIASQGENGGLFLLIMLLLPYLLLNHIIRSNIRRAENVAD